MLPAAKSGVLAGIVLGVGRAIGETMAVIMVAGNQPRLTGDFLKGIRTMTANIVMEMGYASGLHREALIATGVVLFVFILLINLAFSVLKRRKEHMTTVKTAAKPAVKSKPAAGACVWQGQGSGAEGAGIRRGGDYVRHAAVPDRLYPVEGHPEPQALACSHGPIIRTTFPWCRP